MSYFNNLMDAMKIVGAVEEMKAQVGEMTETPVGETAKVALPAHAKLNAFLIKGKGGSRFRFVAGEFLREK